MTLLWCSALASPWSLEDVDERRAGEPTVMVVTPGVDEAAYGPWSEALGRRGLDVHLATLAPSSGPEEAIHELHLALSELEGRLGPLRVVGHGYGGLLLLLSGYAPERVALVGVPLAAQPVPVVAAPGEAGLPWSEELVGGYPPAPLHPDLSAAYVAWAAELPVYAAPACPALLLSGNRDVVAPPEVVRLPSEAWSSRRWERLGFLSLEAERLHMEVLADARIGARVGRFLGAS